MAKINRYNGDLKAFASNYTASSKTVFGDDVTESDTLDDNINADYLSGWEVVGLTDSPPKEWFNAVGFIATQLSAYLHQMGVAEWNTLQEYHIGSICNIGGALYRSTIDSNIGNNPSSDDGTNWIGVGIGTLSIVDDLRNYAGLGDIPVTVRGHSTIGDGGHGVFEWLDGAAPGTYVDDDGITIVPTAGDGSGAWIRQYTGNSVNILWYGAEVGAYINTEIEAARDHLAGGGTIIIPPGAFGLSGQIDFGPGIYVEGAGITTTVVTAAADISPFRWTTGVPADINGGGMSNLTLRGSGAAVVLLEVVNIWGFLLDHCRIYGSSDVGTAVRIVDYSFEAAITNCRITDYSDYGVEFDSTGSVYPNSTIVQNCDFSPNDGGISVYNKGAGTVKIDGNHFEFAAGLGGIHIDIENAIRNKITNNQLGANYYSSGIASIRLRGTSDRASITDNSFSVAHEYGIIIEGTVNLVTISNNSVVIDDDNVVGADTKGFVHVNARNEITCIGNVIEIVRDTVTEGVFHVDSTAGFVSIIGNMIHGLGGVISATGIKCESGVTGVSISDNGFYNLTVGIDINKTGTVKYFSVKGNLFTNVTTEMSLSSWDAVFVRDNIGFITQAKGLATIPSGATTVSVAHGLDITPSATNVAVWAYGTSTNDPGQFWVQSTDATNLVINCRNDPGAGGFPIRWKHETD